MVIIEYGGNTVEPEAVESEFVEPIFAVGEEEMDYLVLAVVETERVPCWVFPTVVAIEILIVRAVEPSQPFYFVFDGVGVDNVHDYGYTLFVGFVDERFQVVGCTEPR